MHATEWILWRNGSLFVSQELWILYNFFVHLKLRNGNLKHRQGQTDVTLNQVVKKVKCSRYGPVVVQRVVRGIALLFHDRGTWRGWVVCSTPRPPLPPGRTPYPLYRKLGGPQDRSWRAENLVLTGIRSRTVRPIAQSLYRLSYPAHNQVVEESNNAPGWLLSSNDFIWICEHTLKKIPWNFILCYLCVQETVLNCWDLRNMFLFSTKCLFHILYICVHIVQTFS